MNYNEKVEFLKGYAKAKENIKTYLRQMEDLRETMLPSGISYSDMPKHPNYDDKMADYAVKHMDIQKRLDKAQAKQLAVIAAINQIAEVDPVGHRILTERYVSGKSFYRIEKELRVSRNTRRKYHKIAIERLKI